MRFLRKEKKILPNKKITEYKLLNHSFLKKEKSSDFYKISFFGFGFFKRKSDSKTKKIYILGVKVYQKRNTLKKVLTFSLPKKISFNKELKPKVSIIIPVYNQVNYTKQCLFSIWTCGANVSYEIIIADDNSEDETRKIKDFAENITIIRNKKNLGYIKNCNNAAKYARGDYLYFLNNDTIVCKNWLDELLNVFCLRKKVGVVGSKIIKPDGNLQECGVFIFSDFTLAEGGQNPKDEKFSYLKKVDYVSGCSMLTPTWLFKKIGGFDESYKTAYCDDSDYCFSVKKLGFDTFVQPKSEIFHFGSVSYSSASNKLQEINNKLLREKWVDFFANKTKYDERKVPFTYKTRPSTILVIDDLYPCFDKHAGGKTIFTFLESFVHMGLNVKFCPILSEKKNEKYHSILNDMGIEVISPKNIHEWIKSNIFLDYIFFSRPNVIQYFMTKSLIDRGIQVFYYGHDVHHQRLERQFQLEGEPSIETIKAMKDLEIGAVSMVNRAWFPSEKECSYMKNLAKSANISYIPPFAYDSKNMEFEKEFEKTKDLIFVGSSHGPNKDGLIWFVNEVLPFVHLHIPDLSLNIVGSGDFKEVLKYYSKNVIIKGPLCEEDLAKLYSSIRLSVAPLRFGAGVKGKIIDSLYHKTPVVTTRIGIDGIPDTPLITVATNPVEMANKIVEVYSNKAKWDYFKELYVPFIERHYSKENLEDEFYKVISLTRENKIK